MGKKRVYEIAKEYKVTNQEVIDILKKGNVEVTSPLNGIDDTGISVLKKAFSKDKKVIAKGNTSNNAEKINNARESNDNRNKNYNHDIDRNNNSKNRIKTKENVGKQYMQNKNNNQENTNELQNKTNGVKNISTGVEKVIPSNSTEKAGEKVSKTTSSTPNRASGSTQTRTSGNYQGRTNNSGQARTNSSTPNRTSGSTQTRTSGNYQGRTNNSGQARTNSSTPNRTSGSTQTRTSGNYQGRTNTSGQARTNSSTPNRTSGSTQTRTSGNYQGRTNNSGQARTNSSTPNRTSGSTQTRTSGNYQGRTNNSGQARNASSDKSQKTFTKPDAKKGQIKGHYASKNNKAKPKGNYAMRGSKPKNKRKNTNNNTAFVAQPVRRPAVKRPARVEIPPMINVKKFADLIKCEVSEIIKHLFMLGEMVTINQNIDFDTAILMGEEFGVEIGEQPPEEDPTEIIEVDDDPTLRIARPPVVTVMGHVDHGKTSLLDVIRKENVTAREAGGITQHIGAYKVNYNDKPIVFLDTPGHEAFTSMRARGAQVTDIAILVVAADDGVMPQTIEAINHAKAAKVPIIVAINKMDREGANPEHVKQQLSEYELVPEDWGGDTIMVPVSAHMKTGIAELLEMVLLVAEVQDFKANPNLPAHGTIVEAQLDKGRGPVATVLVAKGTLHVGDTIIAGTAYGKVRAMINDLGEKVKEALPSTPVEVLGLNNVPLAGDILDVTEERIARSVAEKRIAKQKVDELQSTSKVSLEDIFERIQEGELKELNIVVKADVQGTIEALKQALGKIKNDEVKVVVVHAGVGAINESDVILASAANALVIGFNVRPAVNARKVAEAEKVDIRTYRVIYDALNDVQAAIKGMLAPKFKEVIQGRVEVRQVITISKVVIAGAYVLEGKVTNSSKVRLIRNDVVLQEDEIETLRRFKDDVKEVKAGFECGVTLEKYHDLREEDILEVYIMEEIKN